MESGHIERLDANLLVKESRGEVRVELSLEAIEVKDIVTVKRFSLFL